MTAFASTPLNFTIEDHSSNWGGPFFVVVGSKDDWAGDNWWSNWPTRAEAEDFIKRALAQHPVNPILVAFREDQEDGQGDYWSTPRRWLDDVIDTYNERVPVDVQATGDQIEHARKVLMRLAALSCDHSLSHKVGTEPDGSIIWQCDNCPERWSEPR